MFEPIKRAGFAPWVGVTLLLVSIPLTRKLLRNGVKQVVHAGLYAADECKALFEDASKKSDEADAPYMVFEPAQHHCKCIGCKCMITVKEDYCNNFCGQVESQTESHRCGCGHTGCDTTKQLGNEPTLDRTTG